jgi:Cu/Zn superoxide dismutase
MVSLILITATFFTLFVLFQTSDACKAQTQTLYYFYFPTTVTKAIAIMNGVNSDGTLIRGTVQFTQTFNRGSLIVMVNITGLTKTTNATYHGLHVHQHGFTVLSSDFLTCNYVNTSSLIQFN